MNKLFTMIKKVDAAGNAKVVNYTLSKYDDDKRKRILNKLYRKYDYKGIKAARLYYDESMVMTLPNLSQETINDLSKHLFSTAYVVCKKQKNNEKVLFLSLFKDTAIIFKNNIPASSIKINGITYKNPNYYVKEVKLAIA